MIRLVLVDDHPVVRAGLRALPDAEDDLEVVAAVDGLDAASAVVAAERPDVVLVDLNLGEGRPGGVEITAALRGLSPAPEVMVLTTYDTEADVLRALDAGARGYLLKDAPPEELFAGIHSRAISLFPSPRDNNAGSWCWRRPWPPFSCGAHRPGPMPSPDARWRSWSCCLAGWGTRRWRGSSSSRRPPSSLISPTSVPRLGWTRALGRWLPLSSAGSSGPDAVAARPRAVPRSHQAVPRARARPNVAGSSSIETMWAATSARAIMPFIGRPSADS